MEPVHTEVVEAAAALLTNADEQAIKRLSIAIAALEQDAYRRGYRRGAYATGEAMVKILTPTLDSDPSTK